MRSVYIHIPFCKSICSYCDFCKFYYYESWAYKYLDKLEEEINEYYEGDTVKTLYIGGGTPSCLNIDCLNRLFEIIKVFKLNSEYEFTFECNINDITNDLLKVLKRNSVNRLSIGVQSFNNKKLAYMNRNHKKKDIINKIKLCRSYGFNNINVDFIYGLPIEKFCEFKKDLKSFIALDVEHISTYSLIIEEHTVLNNMNAKPINSELESKMYFYLTKKLNKKGYSHYEISNFAKQGYESKHNTEYWLNNEYYGFGLGAHGFVNNVRYENTRNYNKYINNEYRLNDLFVSNNENMENYLMLGLRLINGISISDFTNRYGKNIYEVFRIDEALKRNYLVKDGDYLKIPKDKLYVMNEILNYIM